MSWAELRAHLEREVEQCEQIGHPAILTRLLLRQGVEYTGSARPAGMRLGRQKRCFMNAAKLVTDTRNSGLTYCEGYALLPRLPIPIHHAWAVDTNGQVVDVTIENPEDFFYLGITFAEQTLYAELRRNGVYGLLDIGMANVELIQKIDPQLVQWLNEFIQQRRAVETA